MIDRSRLETKSSSLFTLLPRHLESRVSTESTARKLEKNVETRRSIELVEIIGSGSMNPVETSIHRRNRHARERKLRARKTDRSLSASNKSYRDAGRTRNPFIASPGG